MVLIAQNNLEFILEFAILNADRDSDTFQFIENFIESCHVILISYSNWTYSIIQF